MAIFKSQVINSFIQRNKISTIIEFGCGDGSQISLGLYPNYLGFDISPVAIRICKDKFSADSSKDFKLIKDYANEKADLVLSLDVIYHLVENKVYQDHMKLLFNASNHFVIIYSSNTNEKLTDNSLHVRNRKFTDWIDTNCKNWKLVEIIPNKYPSFGNPEIGSFADFFIYQKNQQ
jgi:2-polyprenyl-3-methyl-5-hydroxy-6-metoxy-1,4-benzoquinol methylase